MLFPIQEMFFARNKYKILFFGHEKNQYFFFNCKQNFLLISTGSDYLFFSSLMSIYFYSIKLGDRIKKKKNSTRYLKVKWSFPNVTM